MAGLSGGVGPLVGKAVDLVYRAFTAQRQFLGIHKYVVNIELCNDCEYGNGHSYKLLLRGIYSTHSPGGYTQPRAFYTYAKREDI
jgi:hypothetical protein